MIIKIHVQQSIKYPILKTVFDPMSHPALMSTPPTPLSFLLGQWRTACRTVVLYSQLCCFYKYISFHVTLHECVFPTFNRARVSPRHMWITAGWLTVEILSMKTKQDIFWYYFCQALSNLVYLIIHIYNTELINFINNKVNKSPRQLPWLSSKILFSNNFIHVDFLTSSPIYIACRCLSTGGPN